MKMKTLQLFVSEHYVVNYMLPYVLMHAFELLVPERLPWSEIDVYSNHIWCTDKSVCGYSLYFSRKRIQVPQYIVQKLNKSSSIGSTSFLLKVRYYIRC
jgi:hypothetical protein